PWGVGRPELLPPLRGRSARAARGAAAVARGAAPLAHPRWLGPRQTARGRIPLPRRARDQPVARLAARSLARAGRVEHGAATQPLAIRRGRHAARPGGHVVSDALLRLYHRLPAPARSAAATLGGFYLRAWRCGTAGLPLSIGKSRDTLRGLYALAAARARRWYGVLPGDRAARLGGRLVVPFAQRRPPFWVWNAAGRELYMSTFHLAPELVPHYLDALVRYRVVCLTGYTSSLVALAHEVLRAGRVDLRMKVVVTSAEPVGGDQRAAICAAF